MAKEIKEKKTSEETKVLTLKEQHANSELYCREKYYRLADCTHEQLLELYNDEIFDWKYLFNE